MFKEQAISAYPDGWSCVNCGDEYTEKTIDARLFLCNTNTTWN
jgi:hypothetical protein